MDKILFRCSQLGRIMASPGKALPVGAKTYCREVWIEHQYGRKKDVLSKYLDKGNAMEQEAINSINKLFGKDYQKNETEFSNDYLKGTPDIVSDIVVDTKCPWELSTFVEAKEKLNSDYYWQVMGYMALTGLKKAQVVSVLLNAPAELITKEAKKLYFSMDCPDEDNYEYKAKLLQLERNMIYDTLSFEMDNPHYDLVSNSTKYDIPIEQRVHIHQVERDEEAINHIYKRVDQCREYINTLGL